MRTGMTDGGMVVPQGVGKLLDQMRRGEIECDHCGRVVMGTFALATWPDRSAIMHPQCADILLAGPEGRN